MIARSLNIKCDTQILTFTGSEAKTGKLSQFFFVVNEYGEILILVLSLRA